jgi:DNA polymerase-1
VFVTADYSQIELRVLAHLSDDAAFIDAFESGGDIHRETAAIIFDVDAGDVTGDMRARAKTINFATIYGQGPFALARQLDISQDEAKDFIAKYFERFAGVRTFLDGTIARAREKGFVETLFGRRRYIPELKDKSFNVRSFGERTAMNSPIQGSAADLIKIAMINLDRALKEVDRGAAMLLQVHDELVLEVPTAHVDEIAAIVRREMSAAGSLKVPLVVDVGVGPNWLEAKQ